MSRPDAISEAEAWVACRDRCDDPDMHAVFVGKPFQWCWPRFNVYVPADHRPRLLLNRYPHNTIGVAAVLFGRCWSVQWKASKR